MGLLDRFKQRRPPAPELDRLILKQLEGRRADLTKPRHVLHFLYFGDESAARSAAADVEAAGYDVAVTPPDENVAEWSVRAEAIRCVDYSNVAAFRAQFERVAAAHGGEYDGWEAAAEP
jgi:hypothetical protein